MNDWFQRQLQATEEQGLTRTLSSFSTGNETEVIVDGKNFYCFHQIII